MKLVLIGLAAAWLACAETRLMVTVVDERSGEAITNLTAADFAIDDRGSPRRVLEAHYGAKPVDAVLLVDSSQVGPMVQGIAPGLIEELGEKEQMAVVAFHSTPDLVQDFTASRQLLHKAIEALKFGNNPDVVGAIYATADSGFENALERHVILLVSPGLDAGGRVSMEATIKLARKNGVSVYLISPRGFSGWYEDLAKQTGGAAFNLGEMSKTLKNPKELAPRIFAAVRGNYTLTLAGNLALGEKLKIQVPGLKRRLLISSLPLD
jgi:VWFA-related protein